MDTCFFRAFALIENNVINGQLITEIASERFNFSLSSVKERRVFLKSASSDNTTRKKCACPPLH